MHRSDRWPEEEAEPPRSRASSRRSSASLSRRSSLKKEKQSPLSSAPSSVAGTPKKTAKPNSVELLVTGRQLLKRSDRANSLPGGAHLRRASVAEPVARTARPCDATRRTNIPHSTHSARSAQDTHSARPAQDTHSARPAQDTHSARPAQDTHSARSAQATHSARSAQSRSHETSLEDDMSLDLSQVSDFEDTNSKYGIKKKFQALATSTPKPRSTSLQMQLHTQRANKHHVTSRDSFNISACSTPYRCSTELDYSSVSPEYSGQSSADVSLSGGSQSQGAPGSPATHGIHADSCCVSTWAECSEGDTKVSAGVGEGGEWSAFWENYNNSLAKVPMKTYYDQCPTPYRTDCFDLADFELSECSRKRSPNNMEVLNHIIRQRGLHLTPRDTQSIIKCAHLLGNVLARAIDTHCHCAAPPAPGPRTPTPTPRTPTPAPHTPTPAPHTPTPAPAPPARNLTLELRDTTQIAPAPPDDKTWETATTQTDISLPNTKSAPRIFENILRQLSRSSIDVDKIKPEDKLKADVKSEVKQDTSDASNDDKRDVTGDVKPEP